MAESVASLRRLVAEYRQRWRIWSNLSRGDFDFLEQDESGADWEARVALVKQCRDNERIARLPDAGVIRDGVLTMHNGVKIVANGYYGSGMMRLLQENRGVHEPQEEVVFEQVIRRIRANSAMLELGAYWGFYSLSFAQAVAGARCFLVEPNFQNLLVGRYNFELNGRRGKFYRAWVGSGSYRREDGSEQIGVDDFLKTRKLGRVAILHSDIQGAEGEMLKGAREALANRRIDYLFISTHSQELDVDCARLISDAGYRIVVQVGVAESFSVDGVLVARSPEVEGPDVFEVERRTGR